MTEQEAQSEQVAMIYEARIQRVEVDPEDVGAFLAGGWILESEWMRSRLSPRVVFDDIEDVLAMLDDLNASGGIAYDDYSRLHDAVARLSPRVVEAAPSDTDREALIKELQFLPTFVLGTIRGEPLPLADFTRERIAKALTDAADALSRPSQPVQVEVTDEMVERAAQAFGGLIATNWSDAEEWEREAVRDSVRAALSAALGGE